MPNTTYARSQGRNNFGRRRHSKYVTKGYLKSIVGVPESKWYNIVRPPVAVSDSLTTATTLNLPLQGTGQTSRIGNEISNKSVHIRLDITRAAVDALVRIILFWNLDGSTNVANLLETSTSYQSPLNKDYGKSFWVKFDKTYSIAAGQTQLVVDEIWRKLKCKTEFTDDTPGSVPSQNALQIVAISNQSLVANQPIWSYTSRVTFMDV